MTDSPDLLNLAARYHAALPGRMRDYLHARGIRDDLINTYLLGWNGLRITIPITNRDGAVASFKLAKDPDDASDSPKMLAMRGGRAELYGWEEFLGTPTELLICEGEFDRLVLKSHGFAAVTSTGGALAIRPEWAEAFRDIPRVYVCFDRDDAGRRGTTRLARLIPQVRLVTWPEAVGDGGDVTDFFVRLGHSREDFLDLLTAAQPMPPEEPAPTPSREASRTRGRDGEVASLKTRVPIETVAARYVTLRRSGDTFAGRCLFHEDHTPSLVIYPATQTFHCFGCAAHGDVITFLMRVEQLTFPEALTVLRELAA